MDTTTVSTMAGAEGRTHRRLLDYSNYLGATQALSGVGVDAAHQGEPGTIYWFHRPPKGTMIMLR